MTDFRSVWVVMGAAAAVAGGSTVCELGVSNVVSLTGQESFNWNALPALFMAGFGVQLCAQASLKDTGMPAQPAALFTFVFGVAMMLAIYYLARFTPTPTPHNDLFLSVLFCGALLPRFLGIVCRGEADAEYVLQQH